MLVRTHTMSIYSPFTKQEVKVQLPSLSVNMLQRIGPQVLVQLLQQAN